jgi:GH35 family endo-1,4-beta-xylanase
MKYISKILFIVIAGLFMASCVDDSTLEYGGFSRPLSVEDMNYLNTFDVLKAYVGSDFNLGAQTSIPDITDKGLMYRLLTSNFNQISLNNEMMHGTVVNEVGAYNFGNLPALLATAEEGKISVFGSDLVWHSQQSGAYLRSLIADSLEINMITIPGTDDSGEKLINGDFKNDTWNTSFKANGALSGSLTADGTGPNGKGRALMMNVPEVKPNSWQAQMIVVWDLDMDEGETWTFKMDYKSDEACSFGNQAQRGLGNYMFNNIVPSVNSTSSWQTLEAKIETAARHKGCKAIAFDLGFTATNFYFTNISLVKEPVIEKVEVLTNGDLKDDTWNTSFKANGSLSGSLTADGDGPYGKGRALVMNVPEVKPNAWQAQMIVVWDTAMEEDETWEFKMDYKADVACSFGNQAQRGLGNYMFNNIVPSADATTSWKTLEATISTASRHAGCKAIAFDLGFTATNFYFGNVSLVHVQSGTKDKQVPDTIRHQKPPELKIAIITGEFDKWIKNVMEVTGGAIKDWNIVNEPMDNAKPTEVRSGVGRNLPDNEFYWQDYLGDRDYTRAAVKLAREYGGNDLKLFVNETGLNDNLLKCNGLKEMVKYWESDGTKIDGIGTQLNLSYSLDAATQMLNETNIVNMINSLKETGKLIRISALDMILKDKQGATVNTANVTREQQLLMSKYYNFVIRKYLEIVPANQRYGITISNPIETATNVGLWNGIYERKFTFSGSANGFAGKEFDK